VPFAATTRSLIPPVRTLVILLSLLALGCIPWARIPVPAPAMLPPETVLQLWVAGRGVMLRQVTIEVDSVRGRRVGHRGRIDDVALALSRAEVDSFRLRSTDPGNWFGVGVLAGALGGIVVTAALFRSAARD
jgi:hypothetical protein